MRNFKARFSAWPDCFKCGIVVVEGSIVDIFLQIMHSILLCHLTSGFWKPTRIWARCHFDFGFSLSGPPSCCLAFWLPFLFSFQSFATVLPVGHFNCGIQFEALYVPSANYTKIKGPFLGANFNSQLPHGHLAIGHWSTASWNAFCNLWFVSQANCLHFKIPIWWHAISIEGLTSSDMICPAWDLLIQHLQVSSRLAEAFLFSGPLMEPGLVHASVGALALGCLRESSNNSWELRAKKDCYRLLDKNVFDRGGHLQNYIIWRL